MYDPKKSIKFTEEHQFDGTNYIPKSEALEYIRKANERISNLIDVLTKIEIIANKLFINLKEK